MVWDGSQARQQQAESIAKKLTPKQIEALDVCGGPCTHIALRGGSRSGKTVLFVRNIIARAAKSAGSRHAIFRFRFSHCKHSVGLETIPFVLKTFFPGLVCPLDKQDWYYRLPNGSEIWIGGLDDKDRTEKILGKEYVTLLVNECSQISWPSIPLLRTRLAQKVFQNINGEEMLLRPRMYYDYNPPSKGHWTYKLFEQRVDPENKMPLPDGDNYAVFKMNPVDNAENLAEGYLDSLKNSSARIKTRFFDGEYSDDNPYALFSDLVIDKWRVISGEFPQIIRMVVAVDPSGAGDTDNERQDAIGIVVAGLGIDGHAYVFEDCTVKAGAFVWGQVATTAFDRHKADIIVGERNFGGDMVRLTIQVARANTPYKHVTASRGKAVRATPFAALYEKGQIHHVGYFRELEDELLSFSTVGYLGQGSPNRADALIWALSELFPALTRDPKPEENVVLAVSSGRGFWGRRE